MFDICNAALNAGRIGPIYIAFTAAKHKSASRQLQATYQNTEAKSKRTQESVFAASSNFRCRCVRHMSEPTVRRGLPSSISNACAARPQRDYRLRPAQPLSEGSNLGDDNDDNGTARSGPTGGPPQFNAAEEGFSLARQAQMRPRRQFQRSIEITRPIFVLAYRPAAHALGKVSFCTER